ncbi:hypothetical protein BAE44_0016483 [Dichanthelium oligosanthes]|uniref:KIB1-4 beta-propeller domain-containing protein n=1 Tax=Dichanthelium oligosanthes TaxID=888268 RepID=A0A1E5VBU7_9POAL|nr:hypothetical protein BAE44_0016483 [Dichanthelium oligosanthes]
MDCEYLLTHNDATHPGCLVVLFDYMQCGTARPSSSTTATAAAGSVQPTTLVTTSTCGDPEFHYFDVSMVDFPRGMSSGGTWLVESDDQLFLVRVCFVGFDADNIGSINVYRMDFSTEAWCRVRDIGDIVFLLEDANMAASCPASPLGLKANQIYFIRNLVADDADLCVFNIELEIQEITQVHQHDVLPLYRKPFWILPPS